MGKKKIEVWQEFCDFCEEEKKCVCELCGKDLCSKHALRLEMHFTESTSFMPYGETIVKIFCPNHLSAEIKGIFDLKRVK